MSYERMKEKVMDALKLHFRPEFLNRIDEIIVFPQLSRAEVVQMVDMMTKRLVGQLEGQGLGIELKEDAKYLLAARGYDPMLGARPLRRAIQRYIEDTLSEKILYKEFSAGEIVVVDVEDDPDNEGEQRFTFTAVEGFVPPAAVELAIDHMDRPAVLGLDVPADRAVVMDVVIAMAERADRQRALAFEHDVGRVDDEQHRPPLGHRLPQLLEALG